MNPRNETEVADRIMIRELLDRHQIYIDMADPVKYASLFAPNARYESFFASVQGREEIEAMSRRLHESGFTADRRHYAGPALVEVSGLRATVHSYWLVLDVAGPGVFASGYYEDELEKIDGTWLIVRRTLTSDQQSPDSGGRAGDPD